LQYELTRSATLGKGPLVVCLDKSDIGVKVDQLMPWCDEAHSVLNLDRIDERSAEAMFAR
jgi:hypothetical protein